MKIEICESLVASWLKHIKCCQLVNSNWEVSKQWPQLNQTVLSQIYNETMELFNIPGSKVISLKQFFGTAECDVIGASFHNVNEGQCKIYAADVAFHEAGLHYNKNGQNISVENVIKKSVRTALTIFGYLNMKSANIYFITPNARLSQEKEIKLKMDKLEQIFNRYGLNYKFILLANKDFTDEIIRPILSIINTIKDDNELWVRAFQSIDLSCKQVGIDIKDVILNGKINSSSNKTVKQTKTTQDDNTLIAKNIIKLINEGKVSLSEILDMQDKTESNNVFKLSHPLLVNVKNPFDKRRYYTSFKLEYNSNEYYLCNNWSNRAKEAYKIWLSKH